MQPWLQHKNKNTCLATQYVVSNNNLCPVLVVRILGLVLLASEVNIFSYHCLVLLASEVNIFSYHCLSNFQTCYSTAPTLTCFISQSAYMSASSKFKPAHFDPIAVYLTAQRQWRAACHLSPSVSGWGVVLWRLYSPTSGTSPTPSAHRRPKKHMSP